MTDARWILRVVVLALISAAPVTVSAAPVSSSRNIDERTPHDVEIGNGIVGRTLKFAVNGKLETANFQNKLTSETLSAHGPEFSIVVDGTTVTAEDLSVRNSKRQPTSAGDSFEVVLANQTLEVTAIYTAPHGANYLTKTLAIRNVSGRPTRISEIYVEDLRIAQVAPHVRKTPLSPTVAFLRQEIGGYFCCLAFPYMALDVEDGAMRIGFPPNIILESGKDIITHPAVVGTYKLDKTAATIASNAIGPAGSDSFTSGQLVYTGDHETSSVIAASEQSYTMSESNAWRACIESLYPPRHRTALLMNGAFCEGNMVRLRERWGGDDVAYANEFLANDIADMEAAAKMGFNGTVFGPGPPSWTADNPSSTTQRALTDASNRLGLSLGLYTSSNHAADLGPYWAAFGIKAPTYWEKPEWAIVGKDGKPKYLMCFGCPDFQKEFSKHYLTCIKNGFSGIWYDFTFLEPCYSTNHGHVPGDVYQQVRWLMDFMGECQRANPKTVTFGFLGWGNMVPHGARQMDMFYAADPVMELPLPGLNQDQVMGDSRRKQLRELAISGLPVRLMANTDFFVFVDSPVPNHLTYQYTILQGLALTPNWSSWGPEFLRDTPHKEYDRAVEFIRYWNKWRKDRWETLKNIRILDGEPGIGVMEAYVHADSERSYLFLVNPNIFSLSRQFKVGDELGISESSGGAEYLVREWYPDSKLLLVNNSPTVSRGQKVTFDVPAMTVRILEFTRPNSAENKPNIWGVPDAKQAKPGEFQFERKRGISRRIGMHLSSATSKVAVTINGEPVSSAVRNNLVIFDDVPPADGLGERPQPELRDWVIKAASLKDGLALNYPETLTTVALSTRFPLSSVVNCPTPGLLLDNPSALKFEGENVGKFLGAYVYNTECYALRGAQRYARVQVTPGTESATASLELSDQSGIAKPLHLDFPAATEYWAGTELTLPIFSNTLGENVLAPGEHLYVLLGYVDYHSIEDIRAWINGREARVDTLDYFRAAKGQNFDTPYPKSGKFSYYIDGTKWGLAGAKKNTIIVYTKWKAAK